MTIDSDYELDDRPCPKCNNPITHWRYCEEMYCDDGYIDEYEFDAINYAPGEEYTECEECHGTGVQWWCPNCGADLNRITNQDEET